MPFENPLVAGEELIRPGIRSADYEEAVSGWRVARDGSSEFSNQVVRGTQTTDKLIASEATIRGLTIEQYLDQRSKGKIARGQLAGADIPNIGATNYGLFEVGVELELGRSWDFECSIWTHPTESAQHEIYARITYTTDGSSPTVNSTELVNMPLGLNESGVFWSGGFTLSINTSEQFNGIADGSVIRFLLQARAGSGLITVKSGLRTHLSINDMGLGVAISSVNNAGGGALVSKVKYDKTWWFTSVQSYRQDGQKSVATGNNTRGYQGDGDAVGNPGGNHIGFFFFDSAAIRGALAGSTILESYIYLDNMHSYLNSGLMCRIGTHNHDPTPATVGVNRFENRWNYSVAKGGDIWTPNLGPALGNEIRDAAYRGVTVGYGPVNDTTYYGYFDRCAIRLVYEK